MSEKAMALPGTITITKINNVDVSSTMPTSVRGSFTVYGTYTLSFETLPNVRCEVQYPNGSIYPAPPGNPVPVVDDTTWNFSLNNVPSTNSGQNAALTAYLLDASGNMIAAPYSVLITVSA
jgi:hypothetical protein